MAGLVPEPVLPPGLERGKEGATAVKCDSNDTIAEELDEFAAAGSDAFTPLTGAIHR